MRSLKNSALLLLALLFIFVSGCSSGQESKQKDVIKHIKSIKNYSCKANISVINDKQVLKYKCNIYHDSKKGSRIDVDGKRQFLFKDDSIYVKDKVNGKEYIQNKDFDEVYHLAFIDEYIKLMYVNRKVKYSSKDINGVKYELLSFTIASSNRNIQQGTLYFDMDGFAPKKLIIYDYMGVEKMTIEYSDFSANKKLNGKLFKFNI